MSINPGLMSSNRGDWETPQALFDLLDAEFYFAMDAAARVDNSKCPFCLIPEQDSLSVDWQEAMASADGWSSIWLNPPYGRSIWEWTAKAAYEGTRGPHTVVALLPARTDTAWWHRDVMRATEVRLIKGRLKFEIDGKPLGTAPFPSCVVIWRSLERSPLFSAMERS